MLAMLDLLANTGSAVVGDIMPANERLRPVISAQLMRKNPSETIVDKDNHRRDALKYVLLSLPSPSEPPAEAERERIIREAYETGNNTTLAIRMLQYDAEHRRNDEPVSYVARLPRSE
jgi:hypothetical protein